MKRVLAGKRLTEGFPLLGWLVVILLAARTHAGLLVGPADEVVPPLRAVRLFEMPTQLPLADVDWTVPLVPNAALDVLDRLTVLTPTSEGVFSHTEYIVPITMPQRPAFLLGLTLFRSRTSKKWLRPINDCDPWQLIFSRAAMVC